MQGNVVVVTGGAKGIGRYIARTFAEAGAKLALADIDTDRLEQTKGELQELSAPVLTVPTDVREEAQVQALMERVHGHYGQIDVMVNNAGIVPHFSWGNPRWPRVRDMEQGFWERVLNTNLLGTFLGTKHAVKYMEPRRSGHVINLYGGGGGPGVSPYAVSKDAIRSFTQYVAEEEREYNVCVVVLSPGGAIATEDAPAEARARMPGPELAENRFVLAAQVGMDYAGKLLTLQDGKLVVEE